MSQRLRAGLLLVALGALFATTLEGQSASIDGDLYLITEAGDIVPGAANLVGLISRSTNVRQAYLDLCEVQIANVESMDTRIKATVDSLSTIDRDKAIIFATASIGVLEALFLEHREAVVDLLLAHASYSSKTGMAAHYSMADVEPGNYYLFAQMTLRKVPYSWYVPVDLAVGDELKLDLDNTNVLSLGNTLVHCQNPPPATR